MRRSSRYACALVCVLVCAFAASASPSFGATTKRAYLNALVVAPALVRTVETLRGRTRLPVIVPPKLAAQVFASIDDATETSYVLDTGLVRDCGGAHYCGWFSLSASVARPADAMRFGERLGLGRGVDGDLSPPRLTAYPTDTVISWRLGTTAYVLSVNSHGPEPVALARSIVANLATVPAESGLSVAPERAPLAASRVLPLLAPGVAELRRVTRLPVFLPASLPETWPRVRLTVDEPNSSEKGAERGAPYAYLLTRDAACRSHYCAYAGLSVDSMTTEPGGSQFGIGSGIVARTQIAGFWDRSLVWKMHGHECTLGTSDPNVGMPELARLARSIVANGAARRSR